MGCGSLRSGVIFIGVITMVAAVLGLGLMMGMSYLLTQAVLSVSSKDQSQPEAPPPPPPMPTATPTRAPRTPVQGELSHLSDEELAARFDQVYTGSSHIPQNQTNHTNETKTDELGQDYQQNVETERNDSETPTARDRRNDSTNEKSKDEISSSNDDRFPKTTSETNGNQRQSERETTNSFVFSKDPPIKPQARSTGTSNQNPSEKKLESLVRDSGDSSNDAVLHVGDSSTGSGSVDRVKMSLEDRLRGSRDTSSREGTELETLLWTVSSMTAQQTARQTTTEMMRVQMAAVLVSAWLGMFLAALLVCGVINVLSFGSGVMLIVGVVKGRPGLLRPWRHLTVASCACMVSLQVLRLGGVLAFNSLGEEVAARNSISNAISSALCVVCLCFAGYFYWVVLSYERQLRSKQEEKPQNDNTVEKQPEKIYSCRF